MSNSDQPLFKQHEQALKNSKELCPECGAKLAIRHSKSGAFFACSAYPTCQYTRAVVEHEKIEDKVLPGTQCPQCDNPLAVKQGRYGMFIGCTNFPECHHIEETHQHDAVGVACPKCQKSELLEKTNRFGKIFFSCNNYPKCKYVLNYQPVAQTCCKCQWPVLVKRTMANGDVLICPEKKCGHKQKI
jgi:putative DNA topoisomerase